MRPTPFNVRFNSALNDIGRISCREKFNRGTMVQQFFLIFFISCGWGFISCGWVRLYFLWVRLYFCINPTYIHDPKEVREHLFCINPTLIHNPKEVREHLFCINPTYIHGPKEVVVALFRYEFYLHMLLQYSYVLN